MLKFSFITPIIFLFMLSLTCQAEESDAPLKFYQNLRPTAQNQTPQNQSQNASPLQGSEKYYIVQPNESLSAIAARYGYNYVKLAKWNHLAPPYNVLAGQRLQLFADPKTENAHRVDKAEAVDLEQELEQLTANKAAEKAVVEKSTDNSPETKTTEDVLKERYVVGKNETLSSIAARFGMSAKRLADLNNLSSPNQLYAGQKLKILKNKQKDSPLKMTENEAEIEKNLRDNAQKTSIISINNESMLKFYYQWPTTGKILKNFTRTGGRGIEIGGETGQAIKAAATGKVVAVSPGIYGHGGFIVIQHNDRSISSYANIRRSLVTNGQRVKQGQVIAQMGQVGPKRPCLEFEIRKNGRVVDPLRFLPKKL